MARCARNDAHSARVRIHDRQAKERESRRWQTLQLEGVLPNLPKWAQYIASTDVSVEVE